MTLDIKRQAGARYDIACCIRSSQKLGEMGTSEGLLYRVFKLFYAPFLFLPSVRTAVVVLFSVWFAFSVAVAPEVEVGLDEKLSMPKDSYVTHYFEVRQ